MLIYEETHKKIMKFIGRGFDFMYHAYYLNAINDCLMEANRDSGNKEPMSKR